MKKVKFINKKENVTKECRMGQIGEMVFALVCNVKEMNDAIRWCNTHKNGDSFECDDYKIEIMEG